MSVIFYVVDIILYAITCVLILFAIISGVGGDFVFAVAALFLAAICFVMAYKHVLRDWMKR